MSNPGTGRDPIELLAEEFVTRYRRGERPSATEFQARYPELAAEMPQLLRALTAIENSCAVGDPAPLRVGVSIGEFKLVRLIGRGGMGVVFEAEQPSLGRQVAVKLLPAHSHRSGTDRDRFEREARAIARLQHPHIVSVYAVGEEKSVPYMAMQLVDGTSLESVIRAVHQPSDSPRTRDPASALAQLVTGGCYHQLVRTAARLGSEVANALAHAHEHGVIHRDVKPANILIDRDGRAWLGDFGLAKLESEESLTNTGDCPGTLRYLAPERLDGVVDPRGDVFSLGLTLYELLVGRPARMAGETVRLIHQIAHEEVTWPRHMDTPIPVDLATIVLKAAAHDPSDRYPSATALYQDLQAFLGNRPVAARRRSRLERVRRWAYRNRLVVALLAAILAMLAVGVLVSAFSWQRA